MKGFTENGRRRPTCLAIASLRLNVRGPQVAFTTGSSENLRLTV